MFGAGRRIAWGQDSVEGVLGGGRVRAGLPGRSQADGVGQRLGRQVSARMLWKVAITGAV